MCTWSSLLKMLTQRIFFILISFFVTISKGKILCPLIETLSFGSDINIKCNDSYLIIDEINIEGLNWKFVNQTVPCKQDGSQQGFVNQCGIARIASNYLAAPLKSLKDNVQACAYCQIKGKSIAPVIQARQSDQASYILYIFNITATALAKNESFEILWAKRVHHFVRHSFNYWIVQECVHPAVNILVNTPSTIVFSMDDPVINRAEFIIRRCHGTCRQYDKCNREQFNKAIDENYFQIPDAIEKISCDFNCLNGIHVPSLPIIIPQSPLKNSSISSNTVEPPFNPDQIIKLTILVISIGILLSIISVIFIRYVLRKPNGKKPVYTKTSNIDPDEHK